MAKSYLIETIIKETGYDINKLIKYKVTRPIASDLTFALYEFAKRETSLTIERKEYIDLEKLSNAVERGKYKKEIDKIKEEMTKILDQYPRKERPHTYYLLSKKKSKKDLLKEHLKVIKYLSSNIFHHFHFFRLKIKIDFF